MLKYGIFVLLFVTSVALFFVGLFVGVVPLVIVGAVVLTALFLTRRLFIPVQEEES